MTDSRTEFLSDVIITAIEGGIGYWATTTHYQAMGRVIVGGELRGRDATRACIIDLEDGYSYSLTPSTIEQGIARILNGSVSYPEVARVRLMEAWRDKDGGDVDADDADCIVQAALFGEIRYA